MHGLVRWLSWHRVEQTPESLELTCMLPPQPGYPYALCLTTRWTVSGAGLRADQTAANVGSEPAPFGLGAHPYLRVGDALVDDLVLRLPAAERLTTDDRMLPTGRKPLAGTDFDFTAPRPVGDLECDLPMTGLARDEAGLAHTRLTDRAGQGVELWQDAAFGWIQAYTGIGPSGRRRGSLAIEPMTCPPNAFQSGESLTVLAPGERWSGSWGIAPVR
jgi:aldose 1-epimerase